VDFFGDKSVKVVVDWNRSRSRRVVPWLGNMAVRRKYYDFENIETRSDLPPKRLEIVSKYLALRFLLILCCIT
jgi:hypothetical protein